MLEFLGFPDTPYTLFTFMDYIRNNIFWRNTKKSVQDEYPLSEGERGQGEERERSERGMGEGERIGGRGLGKREDSGDVKCQIIFFGEIQNVGINIMQESERRGSVKNSKHDSTRDVVPPLVQDLVMIDQHHIFFF
jgi:hypothetical protein